MGEWASVGAAKDIFKRGGVELSRVQELSNYRPEAFLAASMPRVGRMRLRTSHFATIHCVFAGDGVFMDDVKTISYGPGDYESRYDAIKALLKIDAMASKCELLDCYVIG